MKLPKCLWLRLLLLLRFRCRLQRCLCLAAQNLDSAQILKPTPDSWPLYHGDYSGRRHSPLTQITPRNVQ